MTYFVGGHPEEVDQDSALSGVKLFVSTAMARVSAVHDERLDEPSRHSLNLVDPMLKVSPVAAPMLA